MENVTNESLILENIRWCIQDTQQLLQKYQHDKDKNTALMLTLEMLEGTLYQFETWPENSETSITYQDVNYCLMAQNRFIAVAETDPESFPAKCPERVKATQDVADQLLQLLQNRKKREEARRI